MDPHVSSAKEYTPIFSPDFIGLQKSYSASRIPWPSTCGPLDALSLNFTQDIQYSREKMRLIN